MLLGLMTKHIEDIFGVFELLFQLRVKRALSFIFDWFLRDFSYASFSSLWIKGKSSRTILTIFHATAWRGDHVLSKDYSLVFINRFLIVLSLGVKKRKLDFWLFWSLTRNWVFFFVDTLYNELSFFSKKINKFFSHWVQVGWN